ncbi:alpha/beta-hydrolase [Cristinia sonorae]|uniref:Alpha/beta-hydrolase n=1 Tax=Cristinia sonorae TaxID=1940300 RepID=A0A8K0XK99_9AGAR|nr:alpha/beta-hydrolase [Cristinia sonorae]
MPPLPLVKYGAFAIHDTGAPTGKDTYQTLVMIHGFSWHSGIFSRLASYAEKHSARVVLVNRRDYPGSASYTEEECRLLKAGSSPTPDGAASVREYLKARGKDLHDFLQEFISKEKIPQAGGITLAGWSFGVPFITSLLAYGPSFSSQGGLNIAPYIHTVLNYDPPYHALGYPSLEGGYNPLVDPIIGPEEGAKRFPVWVSGYYGHGETVSTLELRDPLPEPKPTIITMSPEDVQSALYPIPGNPGNSDSSLLMSGIQHGSFKETREKAYILDASAPSAWDDIKLRHVWCDQSMWEAAYGKFCLEEDLKEAEKAGKNVRSYEVIRIKGGNHFIHWDKPEHTLLVLLGVATEV